VVRRKPHARQNAFGVNRKIAPSRFPAALFAKCRSSFRFDAVECTAEQLAFKPIHRLERKLR
jgi:hypothetical protein